MRHEKPGDCRVLVLQNGARHNYAVPLALARSGMLGGFYTDACGNEGLGKRVSLLSHLPKFGTSFKLLKNRTVPHEVLPYTRSFPVGAMVENLITAKIANYTDAHALGLLMAWEGDRDCNMIYSSQGWSPQFLRRVQTKRKHVVSEIYVKPTLSRIHEQEQVLFPDWENIKPPASTIALEKFRDGLCKFSDDLITPSISVKEDIIKERLFPEDRIHVVPYGIGDEFFSIENQPVAGKILFVGSCTISKGFHYFAEATQIVSKVSQPSPHQYTAAGNATQLVKQQPACNQIKFLGRVPRFEIDQLYADADILVFPTLSDSFGSVVLEAMAAGVPVICSPYCADIVEHGVSGFVVEPRDIEALSAAMIKLTTDRNLRRSMSEAARIRARQYTWENHQKTLTKTLLSLHDAGRSDK
ncbi:glycosyltransferase family 4 protein [Phragmitibacter flavus]|uniref:Glycosyltransferase family 4 protein n=1 Tax=Phragmitibacter flavus TaxID=2576071 RepID=A0A5R8KCD2_9BACT|nr:glycosyltransferase family 4 protein [Phragmitibacter flavus]TLD69951.1 glycosyltransferase family 4 protein [Phragmitibacter flavus]